MLKYTLKRLGQSLITLFIVVTVVFLLMRLMPEEGYFGSGFDKLDESQKEAILTTMGLRDPLLIQLQRFYTNLLQGNLGVSTIYRPNVSVNTILAQKIPYSAAFGICSMSISLLLGITMGSSMARGKSGIMDKLGTFFIIVINAVPAAVYYLFIQMYGSSIFHVSPLFNNEKPVTWILPVLSMSLGSIASYAMWMRRYMVDELNKDYIKLSRAKGQTSKEIMDKHVFKNAFVPMIQYIPTSLIFTIAGSIYLESLYSIPGMGGLLVDAISRQDNPIVQALVLIFSAISIFGLFLGDVLMCLVDPRIKLVKDGGAR